MRRVTLGVRGMTVFGLLLAMLCVPAVGSWAPVGTVERVTVAYDGGLANNDSNLGLATSADGRYVAFASYAGNIIEGDANSRYDIFWRDMVSQETTLVTVTTTGGFSVNGALNYVDMTPDGRYVLFVSQDANYVPDDTNGYWDVFVRDMVSQETTRVSMTSDGSQANYHSFEGTLSDDGARVAFYTEATNFFTGDTNGRQDCIVRDLQSGETTNASAASGGGAANGNSFYPSISGDGTKVAFLSVATNIVAGDTQTAPNIFLRDLQTGLSERVDATPAGGESTGEVNYNYIDLDYTGRHVVFGSRQTDLVGEPAGPVPQVFLRDTVSDETTVVARTIDEDVPDSYSYYPTISGDGRWVSFISNAANLVVGDTNDKLDVFMRDMETDAMTRLSLNENGEQLNNHTRYQVISQGGTAVVFNSLATNIVEPYANGSIGQIYVHVFASDNDAPVAADNEYETAEDEQLVVAAPGVLSNDSDPDEDALQAVGLTDPEHGSLLLNADGSFTYTPEADYNGSDFFTYKATDGELDSDVATVTITVTPVDDPEPLSPVISIEGANRFETAIKASIEAYPDGLDAAGARTVVIATGRNWPDALSGSALAGVLDGPILLVDTHSVPASVTAEITRLDAEAAIILGGTAAVGDEVEAALKTQLGAMDVVRIEGSNRYETADRIARRVIELQGLDYDGTAFVATGANFPDALGAAPLAAANGWPLYLAHPTNGLSSETKIAMADVESALVLGGTAVVSQEVEDWLIATYGEGDVERFAGVDRYDTGVMIATHGVTDAGLGWDRVGIATGINFPDALAGGVLQGKFGSVLMFTKPDALSSYTQSALSAHKADIATVTFFGGIGALPDEVRNQVIQALE